MNTTVTDTSPEFLRDAMITKIKDAGYPLGPAVGHALRAVERHLFVPGATIEEAYENDTVVTKRAVDDQVLSCLSQPSIVALQLGQLGVQSGHRVLEIGAGAGYNAALLACLVGPHGHVTTIDVDADIVEHARQRVAAAGADNVQVVLGDGALGHEPGARSTGSWSTGRVWHPGRLAGAAGTRGKAGGADPNSRYRLPLDRLRARPGRRLAQR